MTKKMVLVAVVAAFLFATRLFAAVKIEVTGLEKGPLKDNVAAYLASAPESEYDSGQRFRSKIKSHLTGALNALGYYHPVFTLSAQKDRLTIHIDPGPVTTLKAVDVAVTGEAQTDPDVLAFVDGTRPSVGSPLDHSRYERLKSGLLSLALQKGYFDARFSESRLEVIPERNEASVRLHFDSGARYRFGQSVITGSQIDEPRVRSLQPFKPGDPYSVTQVAQYNQNLSDTGWFASVAVEPDLSNAGQTRGLPLRVSLSPEARNQYETGLGYATNTGARGSFKWNKPWVNRLGHSFESSLSLSVPEQAITAGYQIPLADVLNQYYRLQYGMKRVDSRATRSIESNLALERHWKLSSGWYRILYVRYLMENYTQGVLDDVGQFLLPGITYSRTRTRGDRVIMWGDQQSLTVEYGDKELLSEARVLRLMGSSSWIRSLGKNHRGLFRLDGAANLTDEFDRLSPSLRFFAGGDTSIRGYGYESISSVDESGSLAGARYMAAVSLEYQYRVYGDFWGALFTDYGDAFDDAFHGKTGTGFGLRWVSRIGPVRLDFAWGLDRDPGDRFRIHFSLGPEF